MPRLLLRALAKASPAGLAAYATRGRWRAARHLVYLDEKVVECVLRPRGRLLVTMPPRHGKSTYCCVWLPVWFLGSHPDSRVILASYEATLAAYWGARARDTFAQHAPGLWGLRVGRDAAHWWSVRGHAGELATAGAGGPLTGKGADLLILDDPVKNPREADSPTIRDAVWDWWRAVFSTRAEPDASIVLIMTRWHEDDLAGRLLRQEPEQWEQVRLPALAEDEDPLGRAPGEPLWPERFGRDVLLEQKAHVGSYWWSALYQCAPSPPEGGLVRREWWRYWTVLPHDVRDWLASWDMTFRETTSGSYVVGQVWCRRGAERYLVDQVRGRWSFQETLRAVRALHERWPRAQPILVEEAANGPAVIDSLRREVPGIVAVRPAGSKLARAQAVSAEIEAGNVYLPAPAPRAKELVVSDATGERKIVLDHGWVSDYVEEWAAFPHGLHDDQVDATTQALWRLRYAGPQVWVVR